LKKTISFVQNSKFSKTTKVWTKIEILDKNREFGKNPNLEQKSKFWTKMETLDNMEILAKLAGKMFYFWSYFGIILFFLHGHRYFGRVQNLNFKLFYNIFVN